MKLRNPIVSEIPKMAKIKAKMHIKRSEKSRSKGYNHFKSSEPSTISLKYGKGQRICALGHTVERKKKVSLLQVCLRVISRVYRLPKREPCAIAESQKTQTTIPLTQSSKQTPKSCKSATHTLQGVHPHSSLAYTKFANKTQTNSRTLRSTIFANSIHSYSMSPGRQFKSLMLEGNLKDTFKSRGSLLASRDKTNSSILLQSVQSTDLKPEQKFKKGLFARLCAYLFIGRVQLRLRLLQIHQWVQKKRACQSEEHVQRSPSQPSLRSSESFKSSVARDFKPLELKLKSNHFSSILIDEHADCVESISSSASLPSITSIVSRDVITTRLPCFKISLSDLEHSAETGLIKISFIQTLQFVLTQMNETLLKGTVVSRPRISQTSLASPFTFLFPRSSFHAIYQQNSVKPYYVDTQNRSSIVRLARSSKFYFAPKLDMEKRGSVILQSIHTLWAKKHAVMETDKLIRSSRFLTTYGNLHIAPITLNKIGLNHSTIHRDSNSKSIMSMIFGPNLRTNEIVAKSHEDRKVKHNSETLGHTFSGGVGIVTRIFSPTAHHMMTYDARPVKRLLRSLYNLAEVSRHPSSPLRRATPHFSISGPLTSFNSHCPQETMRGFERAFTTRANISEGMNSGQDYATSFSHSDLACFKSQELFSNTSGGTFLSRDPLGQKSGSYIEQSLRDPLFDKALNAYHVTIGHVKGPSLNWPVSKPSSAHNRDCKHKFERTASFTGPYSSIKRFLDNKTFELNGGFETSQLSKNIKAVNDHLRGASSAHPMARYFECSQSRTMAPWLHPFKQLTFSNKVESVTSRRKLKLYDCKWSTPLARNDNFDDLFGGICHLYYPFMALPCRPSHPSSDAQVHLLVTNKAIVSRNFSTRTQCFRNFDSLQKLHVSKRSLCVAAIKLEDAVTDEDPRETDIRFDEPTWKSTSVFAVKDKILGTISPNGVTLLVCVSQTQTRMLEAFIHAMANLINLSRKAQYIGSHSMTTESDSVKAAQDLDDFLRVLQNAQTSIKKHITKILSDGESLSLASKFKQETSFAAKNRPMQALISQ